MDIFSVTNNVLKKIDINQTKDTQSITQTHIQESQNAQKDDDNQNKEKIKHQLKETVKELNKEMELLNKDLKFKFNDKADELIVQVVDKKTHKVIREFPSKEALKLMEKMKELVGMLFDKKG